MNPNLVNHPHSGFGLLFEMGLGKTLTAISIAGTLYQQGNALRVLVCCPTSITAVWANDVARFAAFPYRVAVLQGDKRKRLEALQQLEDWPFTSQKWAVLNYESTYRDGIFEALKAYDADLIICDESQRIKNHAAAQSKALHQLGDAAHYKLVLSGTPVANSPVDIYSQYRFADASVFGSNFYAFRNKYCIMGGYGRHQIVAYRDLDDLIRRTHSIACRATKAACLDLPEQIFEERVVPLHATARRIYDQVRRDSFAALENHATLTAPTVLTKLLRLQQITGGFLQPDGGGKPQQVSTDKLDALEQIVDDYVMETGEKLVVFARFRAELDAIAAMLKKKGVGFGMICGDVPQSERGSIVDDFQHNPNTKVFVAQIATAGLGITLTAASAAVFYSVSYSYAEYEQATARTHRIGQAQKCTYIHLLVENSIDQTVMEALKNKQDIAANILDNWRDVLRE